VENGPQTFGSSHTKKDGKCWQIAQWLGDHRHIAAVMQRDVPRNFARYATVAEMEAKSWQNRPNLENQFLHR
jgi:hypothetical protein